MPAQNLPGLMLDYAHPLTRGLVGWWPMNEGGGERINDISGCGNHGLSANGPTWGGALHGAALVFDGSDDLVSVPDVPSLSITGDLTLAVWAQFTTVSGARSFFGKRTGAGAANYLLWSNSGTLSYFDGAVRNSGYAIVAGVPFYVVAVKKGAVLTIYVNGRFDSSQAVTDPAPTNSAVFYMGRDSAGQQTPARLWHGRLYNRALSGAEVAQLYADPMAGARVPVSAARYYVEAVAAPPAVPTRPLSADRLNNRTFARNWRRGETG